jgi:hypothetical protein
MADLTPPAAERPDPGPEPPGLMRNPGGHGGSGGSSRPQREPCRAGGSHADRGTHCQRQNPRYQEIRYRWNRRPSGTPAIHA